MKDDELRKALRAWQPSGPGAGDVSRAIHLAQRELRKREGNAKENSRSLHLVWLIGATAALLIILVAMGRSPEPLSNLAIKVDPMFETGMEAFIQRGNDFQIQVGSGLPASNKIELEFRGNERVRVVISSGSKIELTLDGKNYELEVLATAEGKTLLIMNGVVWEGIGWGRLNNLQVEAKLL